MAEFIEGRGFLFRGKRLVASPRYRLRWTTDAYGWPHTEGELWGPGMANLQGAEAEPFTLQTGAGLTLTVELTGTAGDTVGFRRPARTQKVAGNELG
jgi:hypothetical protein